MPAGNALHDPLCHGARIEELAVPRACLPERTVTGHFKTEAHAGDLVSARVVYPELSQGAHYAVQAHWRIPRSTYKRFHRAFYEVWMAGVDHGEWPATWLFDRNEIAQSFG